jgi:hypothetical protein
MLRVLVSQSEYNVSRFVREDNTPQYAEYLGYIDGTKLYPEIKPMTFKEYLVEVFAGKGVKPYPQGIRK